MEVIIRIETGNAAFEDGALNGELARILRGLAEKLETKASDLEPGRRLLLFDANGNACGTVTTQ